MSETTSRDNCPRCKKPVDPAARRCPHCRASVLVDVVVDSAPAAERDRYALAKALSQLEAPAPTFSAAQGAVGIPHSVLMDGVTREVGRRLASTVKEHGGRATMAPHLETTESVEEEPASFTNFVITLLLIGVVSFALYAWTWRLRNPGTETVKPAGARAERTARAATAARMAPLDLDAIAKRSRAGLVGIRCRSSIGTGFFVAPDLVMTSTGSLCAVEGPRVVLADGSEMRGQIVRRDDALGLAVVKIPSSGTEPLALGDASGVREGDRVVVFGGPGGRIEAREGRIVSTTASVFGVGYLRVERVEPPTPPTAARESEGGPILDSLGRVVGIVAAAPNRASGAGLAVPVNYAFTGSPRLVEPPTRTKPDTEAWSQQVSRVTEADRAEVQGYIAEPPLPVLLAVNPASNRGLVATFLRRAVERPEPQTLRVTIRDPRNPDSVLCEPPAYVLGWNLVNPASPSRSSSASHFFRWLRSNELLQDTYEGFGNLDLTGCPDRSALQGAEILLDGGDPRADRLSL